MPAGESSKEVWEREDCRWVRWWWISLAVNAVIMLSQSGRRVPARLSSRTQFLSRRYCFLPHLSFSFLLTSYIHSILTVPPLFFASDNDGITRLLEFPGIIFSSSPRIPVSLRNLMTFVTSSASYKLVWIMNPAILICSFPNINFSWKINMAQK